MKNALQNSVSKYLGYLIVTKNIPMELRVEAELIFENTKKSCRQFCHKTSDL